MGTTKEEKKRWFENVLRLKNFYVTYNRLPSKVEDELLHNWYKRCGYVYRRHSVSGERLSYVRLNFPDMYNLILAEKESKTKQAAPLMEETEIYWVLKDKVRNGYLNRMYDSRIYTVDDYVRYLKLKDTRYILTIIDWYILSVKYPEVFKGTNYGYYRLVCTNSFARIDSIDICKKGFKSKDFKMVSDLNYMFTHCNLGVVFRDVYSFRNHVDANGINIKLLEPTVKCSLKHYRKYNGEEKYKELLRYLKDVYGVGIDVFTLNYLEGTGSIALTARKFDVDSSVVNESIKYFVIKYYRVIGYHILGIRKQDGFYGYDKL